MIQVRIEGVWSRKIAREGSPPGVRSSDQIVEAAGNERNSRQVLGREVCKGMSQDFVRQVGDGRVLVARLSRFLYDSKGGTLQLLSRRRGS